MSAIATAPETTSATYAESRRHELRKTRLVMIDGSLSVNASSVEGGASERVYADGYWGFASAPTTDDATGAWPAGRTAVSTPSRAARPSPPPSASSAWRA